MRGVVVILLLAAAPVRADGTPEADPAGCESCSARHKAMQKLQDARSPPPEPVLPDSPDAGEEGKDD